MSWLSQLVAGLRCHHSLSQWTTCCCSWILLFRRCHFGTVTFWDSWEFLFIYIYIGAGVLILLKFKHGLTQRVGLMEELYRNDLNSGSLITTRDLHMYVYICKYTYIHTYTPIHTYTYIYICTYMFIICLIHIYIYIFISVAVQMDCP